MRVGARETLYLYLVGVFLTCLLVGNLIGGKLTYVELFGQTWVLSVGQFAFPLTFILTDLINEFYGRQTARRLTWLGFAMTGLAILIIQVADQARWLGGWEADASRMSPAGFDNVFMSATRIQIASMVAFLLAQYVDIGAFFFIKRATGNRLLWLRATGSTVISQAFDSIVVISIAFGAILPFDVLVNIILTSYLVKIAVAILITPLIYLVHELLERVWGLRPVDESADS